jgi:2'-5' RNA ligase
MIFIGYVRSEELLNIFKAVKEAASKNKSFSIDLKKIRYGPLDKKPPRMIWAEGEKSRELAKLQADLENALTGEISGFEKEARAFAPHITLCRLKLWEFRQMEPEEKPKIDEDISLNFQVKSIEVMESQLKRGGAEYTILESFELKE